MRDLRQRGVLVTRPAGPTPPADDAIQVCVTERHAKADIDRLATLLTEIL